MTRRLKMAFETICQAIDEGDYTDKGKDILMQELQVIYENMK